MTNPTSPNPITRLIKRLVLPAQPAPQPEQPEEEGEPTVKMYRPFISYGD